MPTTTFNVTNNSAGKLNDQNILVFLTPRQSANSWTYAAWQSLTPGEGGTEAFSLTTNVAGQMYSPEKNYVSNLLDIPPGSMAEYSNNNNLLPTLKKLDAPDSSFPVVTRQQSGIRNTTHNPASADYARWFVNGSLTCQSKAPVWASGTLSAFEVDLVLYFAIGYEQVGPTYTYEQITALTPFRFTADVTNVNVSLGFDPVGMCFTWDFN